MCLTHPITSHLSMIQNTKELTKEVSMLGAWIETFLLPEEFQCVSSAQGWAAMWKQKVLPAECLAEGAAALLSKQFHKLCCSQVLQAAALGFMHRGPRHQSMGAHT